jgi:predicted transcriptional regulator of viral defense system
MNAREALARIRRLDVPVIETADAAAALAQSKYAASKTLSRLASSGLLVQVRHGMWWIEPPVDPYRLAEHMTLPLASYLSLQTALHLRGMIDQIPQVLYMVSLARTQTIQTSAATYSIHHIAPELFGGFEQTPEGVRLAAAEKALFDLAYLSGGRSRLFSSVPELELPSGFRWQELRRWVERIPSLRRRTLVGRRLARFLAGSTGLAPVSLDAWRTRFGVPQTRAELREGPRRAGVRPVRSNKRLTRRR